MENPTLLWIAALLGLDPGPTISVITVVAIFTFAALYAFLRAYSDVLADKVEESSGVTKFLLSVLLIGVMVILFFFASIMTIVAVVLILSYITSIVGSNK